MKAAKAIVAVLSVVVIAPIWYYLLYRVLESVQATPVMWLLYWVYLPVALLCGIINKLLELEK